MPYEKLTVQEGLRIQQEQLDIWATKLNKQCWDALSRHVALVNSRNEYTSGYDVIRGDALTEFICNWRA